MSSSLHSRLLAFALGCLCALSGFAGTSVHAFILGDNAFQPWLNTATGSRSSNGRPVTLTWSLVADGTQTSSLDQTVPRVDSNLISFLDISFGGNPAGSSSSDLTSRPWFSVLEQTFDRWEALSGINYVYEPNDDGVTHGIFSGQLGTRGDIRLGGRHVDGPGSTLAFNFLPGSGGDMVIDTSDTAFLGNTSNNSRRFRNAIAHELGHGLGLEHVVSGTDGLLLEPSIGLGFDGPQLDEVRAAHYFYGDVHEKSNNGLGNDLASRATGLGTLAFGSTTSIGADAEVPTQSISSSAIDFVSISNNLNHNDTDFFSFTITEPSLLDALLTPRGGTFSQSSQGGVPTPFDASGRSNLALAIFDTNGSTLLASLDNTGKGESESLDDFQLLAPGEYFARITATDNTIQLYQLDLSISPIAFLEADFNEDFDVDNLDLALLTSAFGSSSDGDADGDGDTDGADFLVWQRQYSGSSAAAGAISFPTTTAVPEPTSIALLLLGFAALPKFRRQKT